MPSEHKIHFEVAASLQKLIGEELITNDEVAFIELIKNAYDSNATTATITIQPNPVSVAPYITILDDGAGMSLAQFRATFMYAGYSIRTSQVQASTRVPTGEKGIGRFAADKIGHDLIVTTKTVDSAKALRIVFNWDLFAQKNKKFSDIDATYTYVEPPPELEKSGTLLTIQRLRAKWDAAKIDGLRSALRTLLNPYTSEKESFNITIDVTGTRQSHEIVIPEKPEGFDYLLQFRVEGDGRVFRKFAWPGTTGQKRQIKDWHVIGEAPPTLSGLRGRFLYYVKKPSKLLSKGLPDGIHLYRDGFLLQPFGTPISARLRLLEKRAKRSGHAPLVPNRLFGFVEISRRSHPALRDTTSRQSMLESTELNELVEVLRTETRFLEETLREEVSRPSWQRSTGAKAILLEQARLNSLGNLSVGIGHEIRQPLQTILSYADAIELRLQELHIEDPTMADALERINQASDRIDGTITFIKQLASGDLEEVGIFDLAVTIKKELKLFEGQNEDITFRFTGPDAQPASTNQTTAIHVLANLLRNSVEAIRDVQDMRDGEIDVVVSREGDTHIFEVRDNGGGIDAETKPKIFKKFNTKKTGGLGFGLTYCKTILEAQGGRITFESAAGKSTTFRVELPEKG